MSHNYLYMKTSPSVCNDTYISTKKAEVDFSRYFGMVLQTLFWSNSLHGLRN